ncbi:MAG: PQQ-like beta-propeller repeat protein [Pirellulales bacterium]|nr:PQQ-like beta-propeller repeat protein [Pirellulales bacterium]
MKQSGRRIDAVVVAVAIMFLGGAADWPQFRGPTGMGRTDEKNLPIEWGGDGARNVAWKTPLVGQGHASPIVWGDRVFVCTARWPESVARREEVIPEHHVLCYAAGDGRLLWDRQVPSGPWLRTDFRSGPGGGYACPTPTTDGRLVYCAFGSSVIAALDFQGKIAWRQEIVPYTFDVTLGSSPILYRDTLLLLCAMAKPSDSKLIAFDKATGGVRWQQALPETGFGHSTPVLVPVRGRTQLIIAASGGSASSRAVQSLDPDCGEPIWWCWGAGDTTSAVCDGRLVYCDSGRGGPGVAVDPTGRGDVSETHLRWKIDQVPEGIGSPVIVGDYVYRLHMPGVLKCWRLTDGRQVYAKRLAGISTTWASAVVDGNGRIYYANAGKSFVIQSGPEFKVLAENDLGDGNHPSPAVARGSMFLVGLENVYCIRAR